MTDKIVNDETIVALPKEARILLREASQDKDGRVVTGPATDYHIETNGKRLPEDSNPKSRAEWVKAVEQLSALGLLEPLGYKEEVYVITKEGHKVLDGIKLKEDN